MNQKINFSNAEPRESEQVDSIWFKAAGQQRAGSSCSQWIRSGDQDLQPQSLGAILRQAASEGIAVHLVDQTNEHPVVSKAFESRDTEVLSVSYIPARASGGITGAISSMVWFVERIILGTGKVESFSGTVRVPAAICARLVAESMEPKTSAQLISCSRSLGFNAIETRMPKIASTSEPISLRSLFGELAQSLKFWWREIAFPEANKRRTASEEQIGPRWWATLLLFAIFSMIFFTNLDYPLFEPDETRNAELALNILETGNWMTLSLDGEPYWDKPPLLAWMTAGSYLVLGVSEWSTRIPVAVCGMLTMITIWWMGGALVGRLSAWFGTALLGVSIGFPLMARFVTMDILLTLFVTMAYLAVLLATRPAKLQKGSQILAGVALGLGLLAKGPVILVLVIPPLLIHGWLAGEILIRKPQFWIWQGIIAALVAGPWYLVTMVQHPEFFEYFFLKHHVQRFAAGFNHSQPIWFYAWVFPLATFPASLLMPMFACWVFGRRSRACSLNSVDGALFLGAIWIITFFSLSQSKLPTYILPSFPFFALVLGRIVAHATNADHHPTKSNCNFGSPRYLTVWVVAVSFIAAIALTIDSLREQEPWTNAGWSIVLFLLSLGLLTILSAPRLTPRMAWKGAILAATAFIASGMCHLVPEIARDRSLNEIVAAKILDADCKDLPVVYFGERSHASELAMPEKQIVWFPLHAVQDTCEYLQNNPRVILVTHPFNVQTLQQHLNQSVRIDLEPGQRKLFVTESLIAKIQ
ncbi:MAG: glycosyltransferase family 39 protein [Pirellulaceae bacterium]|nr:glycosyltransferase family 39 protein [Pirellulaceae bacterium]